MPGGDGEAVRAGEGVSYGHTWIAERDTTVALLPIGYADGVYRTLSGRIDVMINGRLRRNVGRICMDQFVVDLGPGAPDVAEGDEAILFGPGTSGEPTAQDWADLLGTIHYEVVTSPRGRVLRTYTRNRFRWPISPIVPARANPILGVGRRAGLMAGVAGLERRRHRRRGLGRQGPAAAQADRGCLRRRGLRLLEADRGCVVMTTGRHTPGGPRGGTDHRAADGGVRTWFLPADGVVPLPACRPRAALGRCRSGWCSTTSAGTASPALPRSTPTTSNNSGGIWKPFCR